EDLRALTIGRDDVDLRKCRVGSCDIRLSADLIARFQRDIDWRAPDADARAAAVFKKALFENVRAYLAGGPGRIAQDDDEKRIVRPVDAFAGVLKNAPYVGALVPELPAHLRDPAVSRLPAVEEFVYWSKEKPGPLSPFISATHVVIVRAPSGAFAVASRDVYSSRYVDASLSYSVASQAVGAPNAFFLIYANRWRASGLRGAFAALRRTIFERRAKNALEETLRTIKTKLEAAR